MIPRKKKKPPINNPIPIQDINRLSTEKDQILPPQLSKYPPGYKSLINDVEDDRDESTDTSRTDK